MVCDVFRSMPSHLQQPELERSNTPEVTGYLDAQVFLLKWMQIEGQPVLCLRTESGLNRQQMFASQLLLDLQPYALRILDCTVESLQSVVGCKLGPVNYTRLKEDDAEVRFLQEQPGFRRTCSPLKLTLVGYKALCAAPEEFLADMGRITLALHVLVRSPLDVGKFVFAALNLDGLQWLARAAWTSWEDMGIPRPYFTLPLAQAPVAQAAPPPQGGTRFTPQPMPAAPAAASQPGIAYLQPLQPPQLVPPYGGMVPPARAGPPHEEFRRTQPQGMNLRQRCMAMGYEEECYNDPFLQSRGADPRDGICEQFFCKPCNKEMTSGHVQCKKHQAYLDDELGTLNWCRIQPGWEEPPQFLPGRLQRRPPPPQMPLQQPLQPPLQQPLQPPQPSPPQLLPLPPLPAELQQPQLSQHQPLQQQQQLQQPQMLPQHQQQRLQQPQLPSQQQHPLFNPVVLDS